MSKDLCFLQIKKAIQPSSNKIETDAIQQTKKPRVSQYPLFFLEHWNNYYFFFFSKK